jgi:hypothetical protein
MVVTVRVCGAGGGSSGLWFPEVEAIGKCRRAMLKRQQEMEEDVLAVEERIVGYHLFLFKNESLSFTNLSRSLSRARSLSLSLSLPLTIYLSLFLFSPSLSSVFIGKKTDHPE